MLSVVLARASLAIFTEGNHLMVLHSESILGEFPSWAKAQSRFADLDFENTVLVTLPQPMIVDIVKTGALILGNLTLDVGRTSGYYPDIVMAGLDPLQELCKSGVIEPRARVFAKSQGQALVVRKGNPLGVNGLTDIARTGARVATADAVEAAGRAVLRAQIESLIGKPAADALFATEVGHFPGRLGITHRDVPEMLARGYADVGIVPYHLVSYWVRTFPDLFELVRISGAERYPAGRIAFGRVIDPPRPRAARAFEEFFFMRAKDLYPRYDFARMSEEEYGTPLALD
jgi:Bacterial extracellular solute-binding protein